jgi:subfamily B ATP-binding cassette protein MsbA
MNQLYGIQGSFVYLSGGIDEVHRWLRTPEYPIRPFGKIEFTGLREQLRFESLTYAYANGTVALDDVSFSVGVRETVAIVGPSGSGKSTLAAILLRFRAPTSGRVTVDGRDCWDFTPESWHRATALVEQDAFLFHGTLRENVLYGCQDVTEEDLQQALAMANLDDVVRSLPDGLESLVGERGAMLSGGQRQRVAIARALIRNPGILILDEATSHLDTVSEHLVQQALQNAARGRTTIVIAHRLSTVREADRLVVMQHGRVVEQGTWDTLDKSGGLFHDLLKGLVT